MMISNFNTVALLCNQPIKIIGKHNEEYIMKLPILADKINDLHYNVFIGFCGVDIEDFNKESGTDFKDKFSLFKFYKKNKMEIVKTLDYFFGKYMIGFKYVDESLYWGNRLVSRDIFELFCVYCAIAAGVKPIDDLKRVITDDMDEIKRRQIMLEKKISKAKVRGESANKATPLETILLGVSQEFHYSFEELCNMTLFGIYLMYSQLAKIDGYRIETIAGGNGYLKKSSKHKHWSM